MKAAQKKPDGLIKLVVTAGKANPAPPVGPALGSKGLNIMDFCKKFNELTSKMEGPVPVEIGYFKDKTFNIVIKTPPASYLIKKAAGVETGSKHSGVITAGTIKVSQLRDIAKLKGKDMNTFTVSAAVSMLKGTATSVGIDVIEDIQIDESEIIQ